MAGMIAAKWWPKVRKEVMVGILAEALFKLWEVMALVKLQEVMGSDQSERLRSARQSEVRGGDIEGDRLALN